MLKVTIICIILLNTLLLVKGQTKTPFLPIDSITGKITYENVIQSDSLISKENLFDNILAWLPKTIRSSRDDIKKADKESGLIIGEGSFVVPSKGITLDAKIYYTIIINVKDGKFKYQITNLIFSDVLFGTESSCDDLYSQDEKRTFRFTKKQHNYYFTEIDKRIKLIISDLSNSTFIEKDIINDNW